MDSGDTQQQQVAVEYVPLPAHGVVRFVVVALWTIALWVVVIAKLSDGDAMGYFTYFTNWSWTVQAVFYLAWVIAYIDRSGLGHYALAWVYWPVNGLAWLVFWLVVVMLADNPEILIAASNLGGGTMSLGAVMTGNTAVHVIPAVMSMIFYIMYLFVLRWSLRWMRAPHVHPLLVIYYTILAIFFPLLFAGFWLIGHDPRQVYGLSEAGVWYCLWVAPLAVLLFNGLWFLLTTPFFVRTALPTPAKPGTNACHVRDPDTGAPSKSRRRATRPADDRNV